MTYPNLLDRFLTYVKVNTRSDEHSTTTPSTQSQVDFATNVLIPEMKRVGLQNVYYLPNGFAIGTLPANDPSLTRKIGFISHMDTADFNAEGVNPQVIENYDGGVIELGNSGFKLDPADFKSLEKYPGQTLITTDGTTLLGADDKSGISIIMDAIQKITSNNLPHGDISIGFTPDEEIGRGADHFDVKKFGADFAYTIDGGPIGELEYESFNACSAVVDIKGKNVHPGSAKDIMRNSLVVAHNLLSMLPANERPEHTEGYDGFYHLLEMNGNTENTHMEFIIRDFDREKFENKKEYMKKIVEFLNSRYDNSITLELKDSYYNMREKLEDRKDIIDLAYNSMVEIGITPKIQSIRGGTDGSRLSFMGLPCPNIFAGGFNFHGRYEFVPVSYMEKGSELLVKIVENIVKGE